MDHIIKRIGLQSPSRLHAPAVRPGDIISSSTIRPNERLNILSQNNAASQTDSSEPLPVYSRDINRGYQRFEAAKRKATKDGEDDKKSSE